MVRDMEKSSKKEGVDVDDVFLVYRRKRLDDDQQWWQTGVFDKLDCPKIYMYRR